MGATNFLLTVSNAKSVTAAYEAQYESGPANQVRLSFHGIRGGKCRLVRGSNLAQMVADRRSYFAERAAAQTRKPHKAETIVDAVGEMLGVDTGTMNRDRFDEVVSRVKELL